jgi:hypothetical protein
MVADPFFCLKIGRLKASIDVKTDSPDPADFATTRHLIYRPLEYRAVTSAICQRSAQGALPDLPQLADFGGFFFWAGRDMPTVAQTVTRSAKNRQRIKC